jgi:RsiW-degrading membrane proteinase PrsW (M82 family)
MTTPQPGAVGKPAFKLSRSMVFPLLGDRTTWSKGHMLPLLATVLVGLALVAVQAGTSATNGSEITEATTIYWIVALYIAFVVNNYTYAICGDRKPWWLIVVIVGVMTWVLWPPHPLFNLYASPFEGWLPANWQKSTDKVLVAAGFVAVAFCEESFKIMPLFALVLVGARLRRLGHHDPGRRLTRFGRRIGITEPLDGILFGVASGSGFFIGETLGQYVPTAMTATTDPGSEAFQGLVLLLGRGLPELAEHSAWTGLFGYFVGLAVLAPNRALPLLLLGWCSSAALHWGWDGLAAISGAYGLLIEPIVGVLSYALLIAALLKARQISPTRELNFALAADGQGVQPAAVAAPLPAAAAAPPQRLVLMIGSESRPLTAEMRLEAQSLGASGAGMGADPIARVEVDALDANVCGLVNLSSRAWTVALPTGKAFEVTNGKWLRLAPGLVIDFGGVKGTVQAA